MQATPFKEQNMTFTKPENMTDEECGSLPAYRGEGQIISCWKVTPEDLERIKEAGVIWLHIVGNGQPPVYIGSEYPFTGERE